MEFRPRDYSSEETTYSLPRLRTELHPLAIRPSLIQVDIAGQEKNDFFDPLRGPSGNKEESVGDEEAVQGIETTRGMPSIDDRQLTQLSAKEWASFKRSLAAQRFSVSKTVSISSLSDAIVKGGKGKKLLVEKFVGSFPIVLVTFPEFTYLTRNLAVPEKPTTSLHLDELNDPQKFAEDDVKVITRQEYITRLRELKDEIGRAWRADDRVTSLKLSIKVARLLMDTTVSQFYPALFVLVTDVLDMLGDMVWERIKRRAEYADDGTVICCLQDNFEANDVCPDAKETCYNWFCKIGSIRELLPRIYLELAILHCWRFLDDQPWRNLQRLVMMMRGLADPLASAFCRLYMARCAQKLLPGDTGYLMTCINDLNLILMRIILEKEPMPKNSLDNKKLLISLVEPTIEWIMKCIFKDAHQRRADDIVKELGLERNLSKSSGSVPCISIVLHHLLKELPAESVCSHAFEIVQLIECNKDFSFDQYMNYRLLGLKLCERRPQVDCVDAILGKVFQVTTQYGNLDQYLKVVDAYLDLVLQYQMDNYLTIILDGISTRAFNEVVAENELNSLQSIFIKLLAHFNDLEDAFALNHFVEILDVLYGSSRDVVNMHILDKATKSGYIRDPTTIQLLFEISQALHDGLDFSNIQDDEHQQPARLISRFIRMVDYGTALERQLEFLVECRGAFGRINELKETLVHESNNLAIKAIKDSNKLVSFVKACIAFNEVTIPSVSASFKQINLYLETAEVALQGGLLSHTDGLIDSAVSCLQSLDLTDGSQIPIDIDGILSLVRKLCGLLVIVPGNIKQGVAYFPRSIISLVDSKQWITPKLRIRVFCAIVSLSATLSQNKLPYHSNSREVMTNDVLFFGDPAYYQEFVSISGSVLENVISAVKQEPNLATRGTMALEACNCILSSFKASHEISSICSQLIEIAQSCLNANDKHLRSTVNLMRGQHSTCSTNAPVIAV
ncbi:Vacuolar protein sorting-associated protein 35 [Macleaya cordata]|uniref:Vacuolar protein sorting-associated protein 35 n=1 Tax=Macleaya cordata TaxID=56857 RepID=A0A200PYY8_MACCD|nr:Vacuolar protein sorting-associated protein 35 [Macleaya cordata]